MTSASHLVYKLEGDIREIDIFKLAPTLLALGGLIQASNRELFPDGQDVGVNVKPFREGSFIVDLLERQRVKGTRVQKPIYEIIKVVDYKKGTDGGQLRFSDHPNK
jgi:hypothetical protein